MKWVVTIVSVLLGAMFLFAGGTKLAGLPMHVEHFAHWGYPSWFMYVTGFIETLSAVLVLIPKTRFYGAVLLICTMLGAIATNARANELDRLPVPVVMLALATFTALKHRPGR
jgi:uncharacterized membrane protein YphA (DoxX/SURF4 family)